ncbi:hypothetical protein DL96DRAFT_1641069 [Flagelloscypha sp. PMI_526]|nr:hypothetical protein DL96DRAFT_1641069 [Flagelloscypha sp. PMI_526]
MADICPIINMNNSCSTGSTALSQANNAIKWGQMECALALGFEQRTLVAWAPTFLVSP